MSGSHSFAYPINPAICSFSHIGFLRQTGRFSCYFPVFRTFPHFIVDNIVHQFFIIVNTLCQYEGNSIFGVFAAVLRFSSMSIRFRIIIKAKESPHGMKDHSLPPPIQQTTQNGVPRFDGGNTALLQTVRSADFHLNAGAWVSSAAKALGPGFDIEKYILAALVVPKSRLEPVSCTRLKASRNI